jgi:hypothetical protein
LACDFEACTSDVHDEPCADCGKSFCCQHNDDHGCSASVSAAKESKNSEHAPVIVVHDAPSCPAPPLGKAPFDLACDFEACTSDVHDEPCADCGKSFCCRHNDDHGCSASVSAAKESKNSEHAPVTSAAKESKKSERAPVTSAAKESKKSERAPVTSARQSTPSPAPETSFQEVRI